MQTERLSAEKPEDIALAAKLLLAGELVAVPTETVYGLAADATNPDAVKKIFEAKNRPADHPLITHIHNSDALNKWAKDIPNWVPDLVEKFWPGPLTLILEKHDSASEIITGGHATIGLRMPNHPALLQLLQTHKLAIAAPSANPYKRLSPTTADQVLRGLEGKIAAVLDGGPCTVGTESTILSAVNNQPRILREGPITQSELQKHVPMEIANPDNHDMAVPGNKEDHYQPGTPTYLKTTDELLALEDTTIGALAYSPDTISLALPHLRHLGHSVNHYRHDMYSALHALDQLDLSEIWVEHPPKKEGWRDIIDRLRKASK